jgi:glutaredoxin
MKTKELLSSWGIEFDQVNVEENQPAVDELKRLGARGVPTVVLGERIVYGWQPSDLAALVGVPYREDPKLDPATLAQRLDRILVAAQRAIRQVPDEQLETKTPKRDRTLRNLAYHIFRLSMGFIDCLEQNRFPEAWLTEEAPVTIQTAGHIAAYGASVRECLAEWFKNASDDMFADHVSTYYGDQSVHALLERTTWHAAQHLRHVYALMEMMDITPETPLDPSDLEGLPLPDSLW